VLLVVSCGTIVFAEIEIGFKAGAYIPSEAPFNSEFDTDLLLGGVLGLDSNLGLQLGISVEYYAADSENASLGGDVTIFPIVFSAQYNFFPRYSTTPYVGLGIGPYFFDRDFGNGTSTSSTEFGLRIFGGFKLFEDRPINFFVEGGVNFVDFDNDNASSYQVTGGILFDINPTSVSRPGQP
jgi:opacity protein-like surface antigen